MKKIITILTIILIVFLIILNINNKENKKDIENNNISIILETEEGNIESNTFPSKEDYEYSDVICENTNDKINVSFNEEEWKLNLNIEEDSIDGNFNCIVHFKERVPLLTGPADEVIISKYKTNNEEGLIKLEQPKTEQTKSLTEYRYSGSEDAVKNYVNFNGETWRIIGVFPVDDGTGNIESRVKIIREESIGNYSWDTSDSSINLGYGINEWGGSGSYNGADLMRLLNPGYESENVNNSLYWNKEAGTCYNDLEEGTTTCDFSSTGLIEESKNMIEDAKWYLGAGTVDGTTTSESYIQERSNVTPSVPTTGITVSRTTNWTGKVGLIYPSDYGYASSGCYENEVFFNSDRIDYGQEKCTSTNWLYNGISDWSISPDFESASVVSFVGISGAMGGNRNGVEHGVRPVIFLSSSVKITSGTGTIDDMYHLS